VLYLTPAQYRLMDFGVTEADDAKLAAKLRRASADVDTFCAIPKVPQRHSFAGGDIVGETHTWRTDPYEREPRRRVYPYHTPITEITRFRVHVTPTQFVELDPTHVRYESSEGWIEPFDSSFSSYGIFGAGLYPWMGASQPWVDLQYSYGYREDVSQWLTKDAVTDVWYASHGFWIADPTVHVNGTLVTTGMTFDRTLGTVTFTAGAPAADDTVEITVTSSLPYDIAEATGLIAAEKLVANRLAAFAGIRDVTVAEVRLTRDEARNQGGDARPNVPQEAADKLESYVFRTIR
jgi:hypothetical protein